MTYNADLNRKGPGLLVRDLERFDDPKLRATLQFIVDIKPDVLALQSVDYDHAGIALGLLQKQLGALGHEMPHVFARAPNTGLATGRDIDKDGRLDTARDRQGYGLFSGQGGIALLSRFPILEDKAVDFSDMLWAEFPDANLPSNYFSADTLAVLRLHSVAAWEVPVELPDGVIHVLATQTSPPVFDGPEDRNGRRNSDQLRFWRMYVEGWPAKGRAMADVPFVLMGGLNNDPFDGVGLKPQLLELLNSPHLQDVRPVATAHVQTNDDHRGPPEQDTVDWERDIGSLRVDYVLPSAGLGVAASAVERQHPPGQAGDTTAHKPVWVDIFRQ